jgi:deoxyribodipyrimidine photo-lyase
MANPTTALVWFRQDLRLGDNPALAKALETCERIIPVFIFSSHEGGDWAPGAASRWWLHHSLSTLDDSLRALGSRLILRKGNSLQDLRELVRCSKATHVFWNRLYEPPLVERDTGIEAALRSDGLQAESFNGTVLFEPWTLHKDGGEPYKVFTPFWNACLNKGLAIPLSPLPSSLPEVPRRIAGGSLEELELLPRVAWDAGLRETWQVGEQVAVEKVQTFLDRAVSSYRDDRNRPDLIGTSRLSPHLHFGEISPRQIVAAAQRFGDGHPRKDAVKGTESFIREVGWREFAHHLLYHFPETVDQPLDERFTKFRWAKQYAESLEAWRSGRTGIPIVDAGMRELWHTGWMHNRVRMIVASLLTKNLLIPWQEGARWFWDTLVDADLANNTLGWQWTAGCGADAAPFFRIFNPVLQGEKFDPNGDYVRYWVSEVARLPNKFLNKPWEAPVAVLEEAKLQLGHTYPKPIVTLRVSRARALERFERVKRYAG